MNTSEQSSSAQLAVDPISLRRFAGHFPTGVAVVTARDAEDRLHGLTLNAVTSVSLDPPLYLACLSLNSNTLRAIQDFGAFGVSFLRDDQEEIARLFATKNDRKFDTVAHRCGHRGVPLIEGAVAVAVCSVAETFAGGDHRLVVGRMEVCEIGGGTPLMYFQGQFLRDARLGSGSGAR